MTDFQIEHLDHVAIRVEDLEKSAAWYERVLGLKKYEFEKWGRFPIFLLAGKTGIALFPANENNNTFSRNVVVDHFAFNVTNDNFEKAKKRLEELEINYQFQDHHYFHSIYFKDLDNHTVELTTLVVEEKEVYF